MDLLSIYRAPRKCAVRGGTSLTVQDGSSAILVGDSKLEIFAGEEAVLISERRFGSVVANEENLMPFNERTESERRALSQKGGKASGAARRKKRAMKQAAAALLNMNVSDANGDAIDVIKQSLRSFGYDDEDATFQDAMLVSIMIKALRGDVQASQFIRDTAGQSPALDIRKEELKLKKAEFKIKQESLGGHGGEGVQIIDDIPSD